ncbi:MAG: glycoside hydrolase family 31 protein [Bacteroidota bacterium]
MGHLYESVKEVKTIVCTDNSVSGELSNCRFRVTAYRPDIFRVQVTREKEFNDFSYAVVAAPEAGSARVEERQEQVDLRTDRAQLIVKTEPLRFDLLTLDGQELVVDDPGLGTAFDGDHASVYKKLQDGERFLGLGEKGRDLDKRREGFTNWNTDAFGYGPSTDPLYSTIPFYIGVHHDRVYGLFLDNSYKSHFNFGASNHRFASMTVEGGDINYYLFAGETVAELVEAYTWLTGRMELPPKWGLGYQQCRYSYYPDDELRTVAKTFRDKQIPCDVIYHDIHYMKDYKLFTWDEDRFPDPQGLIDEVKAQGFRVAVIIDPGVKIEEGYPTYHDGLKEDVFVKFSDGEPYSADVWPGTCHFPDFTAERVRQWWGPKFEDLVTQGVDGFWNDMNEIASWGNFMPNNLEFDYDGHKTNSRQARNVYGTQMARATKEGVEKLRPNRRSFTITRAAYAGYQRYGILWTGDNVSSDESMMLGARMVASLGLGGIAFCGNDVGGFAGRTEVALFARWLSIAVFQPFLRTHTFVNTADAEPWSFGEEVEEISRNYINLRYRLMPYLYSCFHEAAQTGMPVTRSLALSYTFEELIYDGRFQNQFTFGESILVAPVESFKDMTKVYLPKGQWYDLHSGEKYEGEQIIFVDCPIGRLPIFVKAGAMLPMQSVVQSTAEAHDGCLTLHLYQGQQGAVFNLYEDDGVSLDHTQGVHCARDIHFDGRSQLSVAATVGDFPSTYKALELVFHGFDAIEAVSLEEASMAVQNQDDFSYFEPISHFDAYAPEGGLETYPVQRARFKLSSSPMEITW